MKEIKYRDWTLRVVEVETQRIYKELKQSGAESCGCTSCLNFIKLREEAYPDEVKLLISNLGIDIQKEIEISDFGSLEDGRHFYSGWFHFKGNFDGFDCSSSMVEGNGHLDLYPISESFSLGFRYANNKTPLKGAEGLVQIEFCCKLAWLD